MDEQKKKKNAYNKRHTVTNSWIFFPHFLLLLPFLLFLLFCYWLWSPLHWRFIFIPTPNGTYRHRTTLKVFRFGWHLFLNLFFLFLRSAQIHIYITSPRIEWGRVCCVLCVCVSASIISPLSIVNIGKEACKSDREKYKRNAWYIGEHDYRTREHGTGNTEDQNMKIITDRKNLLWISCGFMRMLWYRTLATIEHGLFINGGPTYHLIAFQFSIVFSLCTHTHTDIPRPPYTFRWRKKKKRKEYICSALTPKDSADMKEAQEKEEEKRAQRRKLYHDHEKAATKEI